MKQIVAFIKPNKLPAVALALQKIEGVAGMNFIETRGVERIPQSEPPVLPDLVNYLPAARMEVFCPEDLAYEVQYAIEQATRNGQSEELKLFMMDVGKTTCEISAGS